MSYKVCKKCHYVHAMGGKGVYCYSCGYETYDVYSATYVERLRSELQAERELADRLVECLRGATTASYDWKPALIAIEEHAERRAK